MTLDARFHHRLGARPSLGYTLSRPVYVAAGAHRVRVVPEEGDAFEVEVVVLVGRTETIESPRTRSVQEIDEVPAATPAPEGRTPIRDAPPEPGRIQRPTRFHAGLGLEYLKILGGTVGPVDANGIAFGQSSLSELAGPVVAAKLDAAYAFSGHATFGAQLLLGTLAPGEALCLAEFDQTLDCSGTLGRLGLRVAYHASPDPSVWLALAVAAETLAVNQVISEGGEKFDRKVALTGPLYAALELGRDFGSRGFRWSPVLGYSFGRYTKLEVGESSSDLVSPSIHQWVSVGVRGELRL